MNVRTALLSVLAVAAVGCGRAKPKAADYYPLQAGNQWTYRMTVAGRPVTMTGRVAGVETVNGETLAHVEASVMGKPLPDEHLATAADGIYLHRMHGVEVKPPMCLMKFPAVAGDSWKGTMTVGTETTAYEATSDREEVAVPAGKYKAVRVTVVADQAGKKVPTTFWFAPGVGIVKQEMQLLDNAVTLELEKYEPGKK